MKAPTSPHQTEASFDSSLTPMIDVIFQLMIFFLCTAGFSKQEALLRANLPSENAPQDKQTPPASPTEPAIIKLRGKGVAVAMELGDRPIASLADLRRQLTRLAILRKESPVILDVAPEVTLQHVVGVYDTCLSAGLRKIHFATDKVH